MTDSPLRIAMWSGPRNISTTLMRSWESRGDTFVTDEPFYAHYLATTGRNHPGKEEVMASQERDWRRVAEWLTGPIESGEPIWYQKHMAQHFLPEMEADWTSHLVNCFLIREPVEVLLSYTAKREKVTLEEIGYRQQVELFELERVRTGKNPPVLDSRDILENPRKMLSLFCEKVGVTFTKKMLSWPTGQRKTDGVWAKHWYDRVERSTGFLPYREKQKKLPEALMPLCKEAMEYYKLLSANRLKGD